MSRFFDLTIHLIIEETPYSHRLHGNRPQNTVSAMENLSLRQAPYDMKPCLAPVCSCFYRPKDTQWRWRTWELSTRSVRCLTYSKSARIKGAHKNHWVRRVRLELEESSGFMNSVAPEVEAKTPVQTVLWAVVIASPCTSRSHPWLWLKDTAPLPSAERVNILSTIQRRAGHGPPSPSNTRFLALVKVELLIVFPDFVQNALATSQPIRGRPIR